MIRILRPYQRQCVENVKQAFSTHTSVMAVLPTGCGKSVVFSELARRAHPRRALILAHRGELIFQAARHLENAGLDTTIEKADLVSAGGLFAGAPAVVASVQTMVSMNGKKRRMEKWSPTDFGLIVIDECHRTTAATYREIISYFRSGNPGINVLGVTATPHRGDSAALGSVFDTCAFRYEIIQAIDDGWLVPVKALSLRVEDMDVSHIHTTAGDLNQAALAAVMEAEKPLYGVAQGALEAAFFLEPNTLHGIPVEQWGKHLHDQQTPPRTTLCFTVSVKQSEMLAEIFNRVVPGIAGWVCGATEEGERNNINKRFRNGELPILVNCGTHTEGVDVPRAEVIIPKPTKSLSLYIQMIGRGFRPAEVSGCSIVDQYATAEERRHAIGRSRKPTCLILDNYGVTGKHKLITPMDVLGGNYSVAVKEQAQKEARAKMQPVDITQAMKDAEEELQKKMAEARNRAEARKRRLLGRARFAVRTVNPFDESEVSPMKMVARTGAPLSEKQRYILTNKLGRDPDKIPVGFAKRLIGDYFARFKK